MEARQKRQLESDERCLMNIANCNAPNFIAFGCLHVLQAKGEEEGKYEGCGTREPGPAPVAGGTDSSTPSDSGLGQNGVCGSGMGHSYVDI